MRIAPRRHRHGATRHVPAGLRIRSSTIALVLPCRSFAFCFMSRSYAGARVTRRANSVRRGLRARDRRRRERYDAPSSINIHPQHPPSPTTPQNPPPPNTPQPSPPPSPQPPPLAGFESASGSAELLAELTDSAPADLDARSRTASAPQSGVCARQGAFGVSASTDFRTGLGTIEWPKAPIPESTLKIVSSIDRTGQRSGGGRKLGLKNGRRF